MKILLIRSLWLSVFFAGALSASELPRSSSPEGAQVYIVSPVDGAVVNSPVDIVFGLKGMGVAPAGTDKANTGHHHLLVDGKMLPAMDKPMGGEVTHFGGGQTETSVELSSGVHTLQIILGDKNHIPHNPPVVSEKITITVK
ncbi:DUF4399 domain-containing protein [Oceanicoccus sagamiensis]|uniref:Rod shape-determining protein RodA n=1 Tax=Oceanicoccus sagamiensis TaxID=716816 RepID=A0A1X9NDH4_9GAMM|nr:DUF4399 domain-containing protein [Oceanicoccus sagamiensis]ARN76098.1 rod shape-determining protein RodA [Oceanicoccus sagamiensis]